MLDPTQYPTYLQIILKLPAAALPLGVTLLTSTPCIEPPGIVVTGVSWEDQMAICEAGMESSRRANILLSLPPWEGWGGWRSLSHSCS